MGNETLSGTIAAISTPLGFAGIGIVRVSGPLCQRIAAEIFRPARSAHPLPSHRLCYGRVVDPSSGRMIDEVLVALMRAPYTYTREDCLEIQAHGGVTVLQEVLNLVLKSGARLAEPGEFTLRAFLNGRLDLTQAEAVVDIVQARSHTSLELARRQLQGSLSTGLRRIQEDLLDALALLEVAIDFPEEDISETETRTVCEILSRTAASLGEWIASFQKGRIGKEGAAIMIIGAPNSGKSSLLNAMLGFERAIVTDIPGTTRDMVEEWMEWKGLPIRAIDTAGLRDPEDVIEAQGHRLLLERVRQVDLIIWVVDASRPLPPIAPEAAALIQDRPCIVALNKSDLPPFSPPQALPSFLRSPPSLKISAKEGWGIDALLDLAQQTLMGEGFGEALLLTNMRHKTLLDAALGCVLRAETALERSDHIELAAADLHEAQQALQEVLGQKVDDAVLSRIFSKFCIGK